MPVTQIREPGLVGAFGCPDRVPRARAVLALGGSEGGIPDYLMRLLVAEVFAWLALAYVATPDTQPALTEVPLERVETGLARLRAIPKSRSRTVGFPSTARPRSYSAGRDRPLTRSHLRARQRSRPYMNGSRSGVPSAPSTKCSLP